MDDLSGKGGEAWLLGLGSGYVLGDSLTSTGGQFGFCGHDASTIISRE
jgi:hypothetical protein